MNIIAITWYLKDFFVYLVKIYILRFVDCVLTVLTARVIALTTINFGVFWLKKKFLCSPKLTPSPSQADHCIILTLLTCVQTNNAHLGIENGRHNKGQFKATPSTVWIYTTAACWQGKVNEQVSIKRKKECAWHNNVLDTVTCWTLWWICLSFCFIIVSIALFIPF